MKFSFFLAAVFVSRILTSRVIALDENSLSRLILTRYYRRLKGFRFDTFYSASLLSCALQCQRNPRCVSTNFRKSSTFEETDGICELNNRGVMLPQATKERELVHDEETVYSQFYDRKYDCPLTGCMNGDSCVLNEMSKVYKCTPLKSCAELYNAGKTSSGVYTINPGGSGAFDVFCDQTTNGGGWTVFQKRKDGSVDFYRDWGNYKKGFGNLNGEFWLGLDKIHRLASSDAFQLRVDLEDWEGETRFAEYDMFAIGDEASKYRLSLGSYSGSAGDSLTTHRGYPFTTNDQDNDGWGTNCAVVFKGAWWYRACHSSNLNGLYHQGGPHSSYVDGINWLHWKGLHYSMKRAEMKIRPVIDFPYTSNDSFVGQSYNHRFIELP